MSIVDSVKKWVFSIALKKGLKRGVQVLIAIAVAKGVGPILANFGVQVDFAKLEVELTTAVFAGMEVLRNWLKVKFNLGWL